MFTNVNIELLCDLYRFPDIVTIQIKYRRLHNGYSISAFSTGERFTPKAQKRSLYITTGQTKRQSMSVLDTIKGSITFRYQDLRKP